MMDRWSWQNTATLQDSFSERTQIDWSYDLSYGHMVLYLIYVNNKQTRGDGSWSC